MNKLEKNIKRDNTGLIIYYIYRGLKLSIFLLNILVIYFALTNNPKLLILSLVFNIIYVALYIQRFWLIIPAGIICFYFNNDILLAISLGFAIGNSISYIIDFIFIFLFKIILSIINKIDKNK